MKMKMKILILGLSSVGSVVAFSTNPPVQHLPQHVNNRLWASTMDDIDTKKKQSVEEEPKELSYRDRMTNSGIAGAAAVDRRGRPSTRL
jgi:hypothetical protein